MAYIAYLLRLWRVDDDKDFAWRVYIQNPHTGERQAFASLKEMCAFLEEKTSLFNENSEPYTVSPENEL